MPQHSMVFSSSPDSEATNSVNFDEFEEMWAHMGEQLEAQALSKRPLSPTPESQLKCETLSSVAGYSPALDSNCSVFASATSYSTAPSFDEGRFNHVEDSVLTNLWYLIPCMVNFINRRTNPVKIQQLEKRMSTPGKGTVSEFKEQFDLIRSLVTRVEQDCVQKKIILNFLGDNTEKKKSCVKKVKFTTL
ncbi:uncharacterized protein LOC144624660 [Crassostrea virginica]